MRTIIIIAIFGALYACMAWSLMGQTPTPAKGGSLLKSDGAEWVAVTPEIEAVLNKDPVWQFIHKVDTEAGKRPEWNRDYTYAHYRAFVEEGEKHVMDLLKKKGLVK